jgi:hypothetical protein
LQQVIKEIKLPLFSLHIDMALCRFQSIEEVVAYLKNEISSHKATEYIATFNHMKHTRKLPEGQIAEGITAAYNLVFCFGFTLQDPEQLALRPRSIGVCENESGITISFLEAPMPVANALMEQWAKALIRERNASHRTFASNSSEQQRHN